MAQKGPYSLEELVSSAHCLTWDTNQHYINGSNFQIDFSKYRLKHSLHL